MVNVTVMFTTERGTNQGMVVEDAPSVEEVVTLVENLGGKDVTAWIATDEEIEMSVRVDDE